MKSAASASLLRLHIGERDRFGARPLYEEIVARARQAGADQVTVYRGIEGYGSSSLIHRPGWFGRSQDAPIVVTVIASDDVMSALQPQLNQIVDEGLIALSRAEIIRYTEENHVAD